MEKQYMLEKMIALVDGQPGWRVYECKPVGNEVGETIDYTHAGVAAGHTEEDALKNFLAGKFY